MIGFLAATPAERRLIPGGRLQGPTPYVIAIMMFVMVVIGASGLALGSSARLVAAGVDNRYSIEISDGAAKAATAQALLVASPGVVAVRPVSEIEMRKILQRWLAAKQMGRGINKNDLGRLKEIEDMQRNRISIGRVDSKTEKN